MSLCSAYLFSRRESPTLSRISIRNGSLLAPNFPASCILRKCSSSRLQLLQKCTLDHPRISSRVSCVGMPPLTDTFSFLASDPYSRCILYRYLATQRTVGKSALLEDANVASLLLSDVAAVHDIPLSMFALRAVSHFVRGTHDVAELEKER